MKKVLVSLSGLLVPGLGHVILGKRGKGAVLFVVLVGMFVVGIALDSDYFHRFGISPMGEQFEPIQDQSGAGDEGWIDPAWRILFTYVFPFVVGIGTYLLGFVLRDVVRPIMTMFPFIPDTTHVPVTVKDIGYCFALLSGLLNILVMMDAYDVAYNAELFDETEERRDRWLK